MSTKNNLKDRIKKPNATQAFFNSYDNNENDTNNIDVIKNDDKVNDVDNKKVEHNNHAKNVVDNVNKNEDKTYVNNDNNNNNIVIVDDEDDDYFRELATGKKPTKKKTKKVFTSFYMDPDLAVEVDKIASRGEKGDKSKLINMGIRKLLEDYGVIEKK
ncbi:ribbon-helix-helix domain-containing protein [Bacillus sp. sid0103]|uniref:ribbon-helix-helix domain-containing protein n=1 Tax=Bacillus sp. sid0103 TaxID=2856337 RepID=UPI001C45BD5C|nr:ribbon-helix-helix domain-containing protein [Bacillus sp. sid0103]MBV7508880.1 ribbon-helix-helix domain-containing protein [Bacillus sp. sid0103]